MKFTQLIGKDAAERILLHLNGQIPTARVYKVTEEMTQGGSTVSVTLDLADGSTAILTLYVKNETAQL